MKPIRIQRKRSKGWRMPENTVYVGRPTKWGNPYVVNKSCDVRESVRLFDASVRGFMSQGLHCPPNAHPESRIGIIISDISQLRGKNLACWCPIGSPCHADVLLMMANDEVGDD